MKVKELIEVLKQYPEDMEVEIWKGWDSYSQSDYYAELCDIEVTEDGKLTI